MSMKTIVSAAATLAIFAAMPVLSASAQSANKYPNFRDSSQAYNSRVIAGAAPNWYATFIEGDRCSYQYRVINGQRVRYEVCN